MESEDGRRRRHVQWPRGSHAEHRVQRRRQDVLHVQPRRRDLQVGPRGRAAVRASVRDSGSGGSAAGKPRRARASASGAVARRVALRDAHGGKPGGTVLGCVASATALVHRRPRRADHRNRVVSGERTAGRLRHARPRAAMGRRRAAASPALARTVATGHEAAGDRERGCLFSERRSDRRGCNQPHASRTDSGGRPRRRVAGVVGEAALETRSPARARRRARVHSRRQAPRTQLRGRAE